MIDLVIHMDASRRITVTGPIEDRMLCYALLEIARDIIAERARAKESRILPATTLPSVPPHGG